VVIRRSYYVIIGELQSIPQLPTRRALPEIWLPVDIFCKPKEGQNKRLKRGRGPRQGEDRQTIGRRRPDFDLSLSLRSSLLWSQMRAVTVEESLPSGDWILKGNTKKMIRAMPTRRQRRKANVHSTAKRLKGFPSCNFSVIRDQPMVPLQDRKLLVPLVPPKDKIIPPLRIC